MADWLLDVFVPGKPAPQGSKHARPIYRGKGEAREFTGKVVTVESSKSGVDAWRGDVRRACADRWGARPPLDGPVLLDVEFVRKRPASAPKSRTPHATTMPDLSKLVRSTEDAITSAGVWVDDARVVRTVSSKRVAEIGETPGARIRIALWTRAVAFESVQRVVEYHRGELLRHCDQLVDDHRFVTGASWSVRALDRVLLALAGETDPVALGLQPQPAEQITLDDLFGGAHERTPPT